MIFLQDPVMLSAGVVLAATIIILVWAVKSLTETSPEHQDTTYEDIQPNAPQPQNDENAGLAEARLQAILNQLNDISQRLIEIEKAVKTSKTSDQTIPLLLTPQKLDESFRRIEARIDAAATVKSQAPATGGQDITSLETKLDGIHKLLIYLTDTSK
jgi:hypothetical protein